MSEVQYKMFTHKTALQIAEKVMAMLTPHCQVINIAGSIRREKPEVKDIEIVCVAKTVKVGTLDLFGNDDRKTVISPDFAKTVNELGKIVKGKPEGRMMQIVLPEKIVLDLFMPMPYDYWRQFAIRTGSADYSHKVIATGWLKMGWCGTSQGLRLQDECNGVKNNEGKTVWTIKASVVKPTLPPVWSSEQEFFDWLGVQYQHPKMRNINY